MEKVLTHRRYAEHRIKDIKNWGVSQDDKKDLKLFLKAYETGQVSGRIGTNLNATLERTLEYLKPAFTFINKSKPVTKLDNEDKEIIQDFLTALLKNKILSHKKKPYSLKTKKLMLRTLINYIKWRLPENHLPLTRILAIRIENKMPEPDFLREEEIEKLYRGCSEAYQRYAVAVLFSSGMRAEEFLNVRFSDIEMPKKDETYVKIRIRNPFSKSAGRTIPLFWKFSLESVREYLDQRIREGIQPEEPVFVKNYDTMRSWFYSLGKRILNKNLHFHLFRSSAATFLQSKFKSRQDFCYYFGWRYSSPMVDRYANRCGIDLNPITETFERTDIEDLRVNLEKEKTKKDFELEELRTELKKTQEQLSKIAAQRVPLTKKE